MGQFILKAGHHGSRTSSTEPFVSALQPELTIFSAGRNNRYGHPHPEVMEVFQNRGLKTMSTAEWGSITVTVKGRGYQIKSMKDEKTVYSSSLKGMRDRFFIRFISQRLRR